MVATIVISGVGSKKHRKLKAHLQNKHLLGDDQHPRNEDQVLKALKKCAEIGTNTENSKFAGGLSFAQARIVPADGTDRELHPNLEHCKCKQMCHYKIIYLGVGDRRGG